ncbi:MAG: hypothetical protein H6611_04010 [Ignavibacteriales bacterium]|nr:hypothetical protein [Ignavibacteriales bacterium]
MNKILFILFFISISNNYFQTFNATNISRDKYLYLLSPQGTESFDAHEDIIISWDSFNIDKIDISISNDGTNWIAIISNYPTSNNNYFLSCDSIKVNNFLLRINDSNDNKIFDQTNFYIQLLMPQSNLKTIAKNELVKNITIPIFKIMPLGDSITDGYLLPISSNERDGYRKHLQEIIINNGLLFDFVGSVESGTFIDKQHEGHGGWHARHWYPNFKYDMNSHINLFLNLNNPDIILLHIGTNDIGEYYDNRNDNNIDTTVSDVSDLIDSIYVFNPEIKIILAKIINRTDDINSNINESITTSQYNNALFNMILARQEYGTKLFIVDQESALNYPSDLSDGVHPNQSGYDKMAKVWFDGIISILPKLDAKIFLEGTYADQPNLNFQLNLSGAIPVAQPFNHFPWNFNGTELAQNIPNNIVDWVLVSLRSETSASSEVAKRAGFLRNDGKIVDLDGTSPLAFVVENGDYYVVVEHRNHLSVMSSSKITFSWLN